MTPRIRYLFALAVVAAMGACRPPCRPGGPGPWTVTGAPVPDTYLAEISAAVDVLQETQGLCAGGTVNILPEPFACQVPSGLCAGMCYGPQSIDVVYDPDIYLGRTVGSTALEHELCHAAGIEDEAGASACAAGAMPAIKERLAAP